jgi:hypothetical protein
MPLLGVVIHSGKGVIPVVHRAGNHGRNRELNNFTPSVESISENAVKKMLPI